MTVEKKEIKFEQPSEILVMANRFIWLIIAVIFLGVLALGYFLILSPGISDIKSKRTATEESNFIKSKHEELLKRLQELKSEYGNIKTTRTEILDKLKAALPDQPQTAELFILADRLAKDRGFILQKMEIVENKDNNNKATQIGAPPTASVPQGLPTALSAKIGGSGISSSANLALATSSLALNSLIIHLSLNKEAPAGKESSGPQSPAKLTILPYDAFKAYLSDLESNLRLMDIQSVAFGEFSPDQPATFNISLVTYYQ